MTPSTRSGGKQPARKQPGRRRKEPPANHKKVPLALVRGKHVMGASGARGGTSRGCDLSLQHGVSATRCSGRFAARSRLTEDGSLFYIGTFDTPEEAGQAVVAYEYAKRHLRKQTPVPMTAEAVHKAAAAEGLTLTPGSGAGGFMNVSFNALANKFMARQNLGGKSVYHGIFFTPEEAALACARAFMAHNA